MLQLDEEQPEHELPVPAIGVDIPEALFLENDKNLESTFPAGLLQTGQGVSLSDSLIERIFSNLFPHELHTYSYIGIT